MPPSRPTFILGISAFCTGGGRKGQEGGPGGRERRFGQVGLCAAHALYLGVEARRVGDAGGAGAARTPCRPGVPRPSRRRWRPPPWLRQSAHTATATKRFSFDFSDSGRGNRRRGTPQFA